MWFEGVRGGRGERRGGGGRKKERKGGERTSETQGVCLGVFGHSGCVFACVCASPSQWVSQASGVAFTFAYALVAKSRHEEGKCDTLRKVRLQRHEEKMKFEKQTERGERHEARGEVCGV